MKMFIYVLALLLCACSAKRKLMTKSSANKEQLLGAQSRQTQKRMAKSYQLGRDSVGQTTWIKIYPKATFMLDKNGFVGMADSLAWYGNRSQFSQRVAMAEKSKEQVRADRITHVQVENTKEKTKGIFKIGPATLWAIACVVIFGVLDYVYKRNKKINMP